MLNAEIVEKLIMRLIEVHLLLFSKVDWRMCCCSCCCTLASVYRVKINVCRALVGL